MKMGVKRVAQEEIVKQVAKRCGLSEPQVEQAVARVFQTIVDTLADGATVKIAGLGTLRPPESKAACPIDIKAFLPLSGGARIRYQGSATGADMGCQ